jgi:ribonuclease HI
MGELRRTNVMSDSKYYFDQVYGSYMASKDKQGRKRKHPSRDEFEGIVRYARAWDETIRVFSVDVANTSSAVTITTTGGPDEPGQSD